MRETIDFRENIRDLGEKLIRFDLKNADRYYYLRSTSREFNRFIFLILGFWIVMNLLPLLAKYIYPPAAGYRVDLFSQCVVGGLFFLLVFLEIYARIKIKKQHKEAKALLAKREGMISQLNKHKSHYNSENIADWWNHINGFGIISGANQLNKIKPPYTLREFCISHAPFQRIEFDEDRIPRLRLKPNIERNITGTEVFALCDNPNLRMILNAGIENEKIYGLAEFVIYERSEEIIKRYATLSEQDIQSKVDVLRAENDSRERFLNTFEGQFSTTDKERLFEGTISQERYNKRAFERKSKEIDYEYNLRQNKEVYVGNQLERTAIVSPIGIAVLDESGIYRGLFLYKEMPSREFYRLEDFGAIRYSNKMAALDTTSIFSYFLLMNFGEGFDVAQERPTNFTDEEWAYWVYAQYYKS